MGEPQKSSYDRASGMLSIIHSPLLRSGSPSLVGLSGELGSEGEHKCINVET